jgi:outer membrane protein TolC
MSVLSFLAKVTLPTSLLLLAGCQMTGLSQSPLSFMKRSNPTSSDNLKTEAVKSSLSSAVSLKEFITQAAPERNADVGFAKAVAAAVKFDPKVQMAKSEVRQQQARLGVTKSQLDFQFSGTVYAGIEDITDNTNGIAAVLTASKVMYDGGQISNTVLSNEYAVQSALEGYRFSLNKRTLEVGNAWVELERYQNLNALISSRLAVLDPLIKQLEQIADAGVGDATQVAAAQRTVSMIRVTQTDVQERLAQAELNFIRMFGVLPKKTVFDSSSISKATPSVVKDSTVVLAPALLANYADYLSALHALEASKARNSMTVGLESKMQRPFGESGYDSDESIGFVVRKIIYNGDRLTSEIKSAQAFVELKEAEVKDVFRDGRKTVETGMQSILSINKAIKMARSNAQALSDEILLLRKQLVIGQSTLDSVLSAEARLYDAESKEINFNADRLKSQMSVLSAIGRLSDLLGIKPESEL